MNNETLMKIASKVIENRMKQAMQGAFNKAAADVPALDFLRANAPAVGAVAGGLGGATLGAVASRKARIRNALIGLLVGATLGGGAGYLMNR